MRARRYSPSGGGAGQGAGGQGGNTWNTNIALGGLGGLGTSPNLTNRLTLGGGGGSGDGNNNYQLDMSGGAGGGLIVLKAGTVSGGGSLQADGQAGRTVPELGGARLVPSSQAPRQKRGLGTQSARPGWSPARTTCWPSAAG